MSSKSSSRKSGSRVSSRSGSRVGTRKSSRASTRTSKKNGNKNENGRGNRNVKNLKTGWKTWDKVLAPFVGKKVNIMEIGVYEGEASAWFLKNIMTNKDSKFYAVDTFGGSPEYMNEVNFGEVEKTFWKNVKATGREDQVVVMKMFSNEALVQLLGDMGKKANGGKQIMFDIIFIDASHEARDVVSDAVMAWKLLKEGGVMIFDDYKWEKMIQPYFRPKLAIDSFVAIMKPELEVVASKYQMLVRKKMKADFEKPLVTEEYKRFMGRLEEFKREFLVRKFQTLELDGSNCKADDMEIEFSKRVPRYDSEIVELNKIQYRTVNNKILASLLNPNLMMDGSIVNSYVVDHKAFIDSDDVDGVLKYFKSVRRGELISYIVQAELVNRDLKIGSVLHLSNPTSFKNFKNYSDTHQYITYQPKVYSCVLGDPDIQYADLIMPHNLGKGGNKNRKQESLVNDGVKYVINFDGSVNSNNIDEIAVELGTKFDLVELGTGIFPIYEKRLISEHLYQKNLFALFVFAMKILNDNGSAFMIGKTCFTKTTQDILCLMARHFDIKVLYQHAMSDTSLIILNDFKGVNDDEMEEYMKVLKAWDKEQPSKGQKLYPSNANNRKYFDVKPEKNGVNVGADEHSFVTSLLKKSDDDVTTKIRIFNGKVIDNKKRYVQYLNKFVKFYSSLDETYKKLLMREFFKKQYDIMYQFITKSEINKCYHKFSKYTYDTS